MSVSRRFFIKGGGVALASLGLATQSPSFLTRALAQTNYNRTQAAQLLGISFRQLRYQMQKLNIQDPG